MGPEQGEGSPRDSIHHADESSKSGWYLLLLTVSIGGYALSCFVLGILALPMLSSFLD